MRFLLIHVEQVLATYTGTIPLTHFLGNYFRQHSRLGSRDRKLLSEALYSWYRCRKAFPAGMNLEQAVWCCLFLCIKPGSPAKRLLPEAWQLLLDLSQAQKISWLKEEGFCHEGDARLPFSPDFSTGITRKAWLNSLYRQPDLFIRIRKDHHTVIKLLEAQNISYEFVREKTLRLPNMTPVQEILPPATYVVQDISSQLTGEFFQPQAGESWWDCCAGAGGKSILLKDLQPAINLTVSDIRPSILHNLRQRFRRYGLEAPARFIADLALGIPGEAMEAPLRFDHILCDVPCSGSGTWARTPEQLYFFREKQLSRFCEKQRAIAGNASKLLKSGGRLIYMTCSVWKAENEAIVEDLTQQLPLTCIRQQLINSVNSGGDCLFIAELQSI